MRLGTRGSALALAQAEQVASMIGGCEIVTITTSGDRGAAGGDKSRWVSEIELALAAGEIDLAVHSAKDLPGELADGLELHGAPARAAREDVLCGASSLSDLAPGARVGTSSIRRLAQLRGRRQDLEVIAVRGNVDTRLRNLADPTQRLDAIVLARAGLQRLGREAEAGAVLDAAWFVPAPGQGAIALEGRAGDAAARGAAQAVSATETFSCLLAERACALELGGSCHTPLGASARLLEDGNMLVSAWVGLPDGSVYTSDQLAGDARDPIALGREVASRMLAAGADALLRRAEEMAGVDA